MTENTYKRQKLAKQAVNVPAVPLTVYDTPKESLINFPSSSMNGITKEGGLVSLTFKSITCANLVENLDMMRDVLVKKDGEFEPTRINEKPFNAEQMISDLKQDIQDLREKTQEQTKKDDIGDLQSRLADNLKNDEGFHSFGVDLIKRIESENPTKKINLSDKSYFTTTQAHVPGTKIDRFEDVQNPDLSAYEKKQVVQQAPPQVPQPAPVQEVTQINASNIPAASSQNNSVLPTMGGNSGSIPIAQAPTSYENTQASTTREGSYP